MTQPLTLVVLSAGLESFREIRAALAEDGRGRLLAGGDDAEQVYEQLLHLKPSAAIITLGANAEPTLKLIERISVECPKTSVISAARDASPDLILRSMRAGAREFLRLPINSDELKTVLDRTTEFSAVQTEEPRKKGRMIAVFSSKGGCGTSFVATNIAAAMNQPTVLAALDQADDIVLVLTLDIPAIRSAQRALEIFDRLGYQRRKVRIVVNRWSKQIDLDLRQVEKFLGEPVVGFIQSDYQPVVTSINLGQPLVESEPSSRIAIEIKRIVSTIVGNKIAVNEDTTQRRRIWDSFFRRGASQSSVDFSTTLGKV